MENNNLKKANFCDIEDIELGNLLFGHSRGEYHVPREWQDTFCTFLENCGFDSYGYTDDKLEKYIKTDYGYYEDVYPTNTSIKDVLKNGTHLREMPYTEFIMKGISYRGNYYKYNDKLYLILPDFSPEYLEKLELYDDEFLNWLCDLSDADYEKYMNDELIVPAEISTLEPSIDEAGIIESMYEVIERESHIHFFDNDVFSLRPYYWGESDELAEKPNFVFKPTGFELSWYKWPFRDSYMSKNISYGEFCDMIDKCKQSLL